MKYLLPTVIFLIFFPMKSFAQKPVPLLPGASDRILLEENFDYPDGELPDNWWSEGAKVKIKDGKLYVDANFTASTVWLDKEMNGNVRVEYDVHIESSNKNANNINCFFLYADTTGTPLRESRELRKSGKYKLYHGYNGYIITFVKNPADSTEGRFRLRDCPGFHLIQENNTFESKIGKTYHITIEKINNRILFYVDGNLMIDKHDHEQNLIHERGLFGFRTWNTELWWDNLIITKL